MFSSVFFFFLEKGQKGFSSSSRCRYVRSTRLRDIERVKKVSLTVEVYHIFLLFLYLYSKFTLQII